MVTATSSPSPVVVPIAGARTRRLAHVSHELRGALMAAELGLAKLERSLAGDPRDTAAAVRTQLERAAAAADELDAARGAPVVPLAVRTAGEPAANAIVQRRVAAWSRIAADGRTVNLLVSPPGLGGMAVRPLLPALDNLIANALEHGAGNVTVEIAPRPAWTTITVADEGLGFPAAVRGGAPSPGRGLGLQIARRAALACGGTLIVMPGCFPRIDLPLAGQAAWPPSQPDVPALGPIPA
jgi:signal transduction histidine kinase